jgi:hypothetical protein
MAPRVVGHPGARPTKSLEAPCGRHQCKGWRPIRLCCIPTPRRRTRAGGRLLLLPLGVGVLRLYRPRRRGGLRRRSLPQVRRYGPDAQLARSKRSCVTLKPAHGSASGTAENRHSRVLGDRRQGSASAARCSVLIQCSLVARARNAAVRARSSASPPPLPRGRARPCP